MNVEHTVGLILAGGEGRRLEPGKGWLTVGGVPIITRVLTALAPVADEIVVVGGVRVPQGTRAVPDDSPGAGPLAAICTGMNATPGDRYLVVACDMPFVTSSLFRLLLAACPDADAVVPVVGGRDQPLCAAYARGCLGAITETLAAGGTRVADFYARIRLYRLPETALAGIGPPAILFANVNTAEDLALAEKIALDQAALDWPREGPTASPA